MLCKVLDERKNLRKEFDELCTTHGTFEFLC